MYKPFAKCGEGDQKSEAFADVIGGWPLKYRPRFELQGYSLTNKMFLENDATSMRNITLPKVIALPHDGPEHVGGIASRFFGTNANFLH